MKFIVQRVNKSQVEVEEKIVGKIDKGFMVLIGITHNDTKEIADFLVRKLINLRVFEDAITFKIALMVVKYMNYLETIEY